MESIEKKITSLGGLEITKSFRNHKEEKIDVEKYLLTNGIKLPNEFIDFSKKYGFSQFNNDIVFSTISKIPSSYEDGTCPVNFFYGWGAGTESLQEIRESLSDQIPNKYFVIAESNPGDQLLVNTLDSKVYYWAHEEPENKCIFLVANSFEDFINKLKLNENSNTDEDDLEEESFSDDF